MRNFTLLNSCSAFVRHKLYLVDGFFLNFSIFRTLFSVKCISFSFTTKKDVTSVNFQEYNLLHEMHKKLGILHFKFMFYISTLQVLSCRHKGFFEFLHLSDPFFY